VDIPFAPTKIVGPLAPRLEHLIGQRARVILGKGVALAVAEASEVSSDDVRDAVGVAADGHVVPAGVRSIAPSVERTGGRERKQ